jgi:hypothetical protein
MATPFECLGPIPSVLGREVFSVAAKIKALLIVLGALVAAALNGATPWGP